MDINNVKKQTRDLKNKIHKPEDRPPVDWCYYLDSSNWIRSVLAPSTFGEYVSKLDDFEVREFCSLVLFGRNQVIVHERALRIDTCYGEWGIVQQPL